MGYKDATFAARLGTMGDPAEAAFDRMCPNNHALGLNRPPLNVGQLPRLIRYTPDRLAQDRYVECMGIGTDQTLKLKTEKALTLVVWDDVLQTDLFVYDSKNERCWQASIWEWIEQCTQHAKTDFFPDNQKQYWKLHAKHFPSSPTDVPPTPTETTSDSGN